MGKKFIGMNGDNINHGYLQVEVLQVPAVAWGADCSVAGITTDALGSLVLISVLTAKGGLPISLA